MEEKRRVVINGNHIVVIAVIIILGPFCVYLLSTAIGSALWNDQFGVSPVLFALAFLCSLVICGIYIIGFGIKYISELMIELKEINNKLLASRTSSK